MLKRIMLIGIVSSSLLVACSNEDQAEISVVAPKEHETTTEQTETVSQPSTMEENKTTQPTINPIDESEWNNLKTSVSNMLQKVQDTTPTGTSTEKMTQFLTLNQEIETLEDQLDRYEDQVEVYFQFNQITADQFRTMENNMEILEDQLDQIEDILERIFQQDTD